MLLQHCHVQMRRNLTQDQRGESSSTVRVKNGFRSSIWLIKLQSLVEDLLKGLWTFLKVLNASYSEVYQNKWISITEFT